LSLGVWIPAAFRASLRGCIPASIDSCHRVGWQTGWQNRPVTLAEVFSYAPAIPRYPITGAVGPEQIDYHNVGADSPLEARNRLHAQALGTRAVRLENDRLVFADPADRELCAGAWEVTAVPTIGPDSAVTIEIAAVDPVDGRRRPRV
jgi:hypothetical protein